MGRYRIVLRLSCIFYFLMIRGEIMTYLEYALNIFPLFKKLTGNILYDINVKYKPNGPYLLNSPLQYIRINNPINKLKG